jgi:hypothetical protein
LVLLGIVKKTKPKQIPKSQIYDANLPEMTRKTDIKPKLRLLHFSFSLLPSWSVKPCPYQSNLIRPTAVQLTEGVIVVIFWEHGCYVEKVM